MFFFSGEKCPAFTSFFCLVFYLLGRGRATPPAVFVAFLSTAVADREFPTPTLNESHVRWLHLLLRALCPCFHVRVEIRHEALRCQVILGVLLSPQQEVVVKRFLECLKSLVVCQQQEKTSEILSARRLVSHLGRRSSDLVYLGM